MSERKVVSGGPKFTDHALVQLTLVRFREFVREPEALFWVFIFPILLAAGLGIAFRDRPADVLRIAAATPELATALKREKLLDVQQLSAPAAEQALRAGKVALLAEAGPAGTRGGIHYDEHQSRRPHRSHAGGSGRATGRGPRRSRRFPNAGSGRLMREPGTRSISISSSPACWG